jgi:hypothetical protein
VTDGLFNAIPAFDDPNTGLQIRIHFNRGGITIIDIDEINGKVKLGVREATALRDWLNRALPSL